MVQNIFIYMKWLLCSLHLNLGNSSDKFLHWNQLYVKKKKKKKKMGAVNEYLSMLCTIGKISENHTPWGILK